MANCSPDGSTLLFDGMQFPSPSPTPSPWGPVYFPAIRAHFRNSSSSVNSGYASPRGPSFSPRYTSDGQYATVNVSVSRSRKQSFSDSPCPPRERRASFSYASPCDPSFSPRYTSDGQYATVNVTVSRSRKQSFSSGSPCPPRERRASFSYHPASVSHEDEVIHEKPGFASSRYEPDRRPPRAGANTAASQARRNSTSVPRRPQTARPPSMHKNPPPPPAVRQATDADAKRHKIPAGYSLKNWDPTEEPIMLLGSVFDANSLGKWIYDWTVYHHGPGSPIADVAGDLWLLLIQLSGKIKRAKEIVPKIRSKDNKEMVEEFIEAGDRLTDKLLKLLKACEAPMLRSKDKPKKEGQLGKSAGVEFVDTVFGHDREAEKTERFMSSVRLWNLRFDTNCEDLLKKPTM